MERIQLVQEALNQIESDYYSFFEETNSGIIDYVNIISNGESNWLNVVVKENSKLPTKIEEAIKDKFKIYQ
ncbi:hypothetical protein [Mucilaginibacter ginsenosidivorax]|uniref:Uncharacterized protein n=1 Tax=Mucilaginibacter ginsenosidivorax TaxID=862126 RepID=A0A5B8VW09_9SPHI|nr:hypothetical protein [Mucilaginibacter ginsenosidivorax]QEC75787.1 hypothetical protein FSB76_07410 [Mucilaginibacter ginsenosidivorax]